MIKGLISNITDKIKSLGIKTIDLNLLTTNSWFYVSDESINIKKIFIFRTNGQLLISTNGNVMKAAWEILTHATNSLLVEISGVPELLNIVFLTNDFLVTLKDGTEDYSIFVKQEKYNSSLTDKKNIQSIEYVLTDFKNALNFNNSSQEVKTKQLINPKIEVINTTKPLNNQSKIKTTKIILDNLGANYLQFSKFLQFDILFELEQRKNRNEINNATEEDDFITEMQQLEEELIRDGKLCSNCKALDSIFGGKCQNCEV